MSKRLLSAILSIVMVVMLFLSAFSVSAMLPPYAEYYDNYEDFLEGLSSYSDRFPNVYDYNGNPLIELREGYHVEYKDVVLPIIDDENYEAPDSYNFSEGSHYQGVNTTCYTYWLHDDDIYEIRFIVRYRYDEYEIEEKIEEIKNNYNYYVVKDSSGEYEYVGYDQVFWAEYYCSLGDKLLIVQSEVYLDKEILDKIKFVEPGIELPVYVKDVDFLGDADGNGNVNVKDATHIQKSVAGVVNLDDKATVLSDADRSGSVNVKDATVVQKYVADLLPEMSSVGRPFVANPETYRYYFYMPESWYNDYTAKTGNTAGIYWWDGTNACDSWPGIPAKKGDVEGVYYYDVPKDVSVVIWNNYVDGGSDIYEEKYYYSQQTINIGSEYYDPGESENYPEGTENFDNMIYIVDYNASAGWSGSCGGHHRFGGEWYYYYGNGEYGTAKIKGESEVLTYRAMNVEEVCPSCGNSYTNPTVPERPPVEPEPEKPHPGTNRYYFYMPEDWLNESTATTGNTAGIYWWEGTDACTSWPGVPANKADADGVYYYDVPKDVTTIIWNNFFDGGADPSASYYDDAHHTIEIGTEFYYADESDFYPEGTENFDNMIYVIDPDLYPWGDFEHVNRSVGEWFYYYGGGEYGTAKERGESKILVSDTVDLENLRVDNEPGTVQTYRYYFYKPENWDTDSSDTVSIYWWDGTNHSDSWPGIEAKKADAENLYYYDVPQNVYNIMWNNCVDNGADSSDPNNAYHTIVILTQWYDPDESDFYPNGLDNFDGMIYVIDPSIMHWDYTNSGEWFYYYGNGEYGTAKVRGERKILSDRTVNLEDLLKNNEPEQTDVETNRYYFYMPDHWINESTETTGNTAGIYWSEGTDAQDKFPGVKAHKTDIEGIYYYDVPADVEKIVWNNYFDGGNDKKAPYCTDEIKTAELDTPDYRMDENKQYPEDAVVAESMIFITDLSNYNQDYYTKKITYIGEWFYYYGNGEYGASEVRGEDYILTEPTINRVPPSI